MNTFNNWGKIFIFRPFSSPFHHFFPQHVIYIWPGGGGRQTEKYTPLAFHGTFLLPYLFDGLQYFKQNMMFENK